MVEFIKKNERKIQIVYLAVLALYPMLRVGQGLSVMDTTYSLSNYMFFNQMNGTWMVATYLANVVGRVFMSLPFGTTMIGINIYTSLIVSITAVSAFVFLKREIPSHVLFLGELIALGLCWCPTTILYNYLTYMLFTLGALVLYRGVCGGKDDCFVAAGILLGLNVTTRFPNITEAALIVLVWYVAFIERKKWVRVLKETLMCLLGYIIGFVIPYVMIAIKYKATSYGDMIHNLFAMTDKAVDYKPTSMITAMFGDYVYASRWLFILFIAFAVSAMISLVWRLFYPQGVSNQKNNRYVKFVPVLASIFVTLFALRICYGNGMFSLNFYEARSVYFLAIAIILSSTIISLVYVFAPEEDRRPLAGPNLYFHRKKIMGMMCLIVTYITCLGSNNGMYPIVNNMFIVMPYVLWVIYEWILDIKNKPSNIKKDIKFGASGVLVIIAMLTLIQSIGFHMNFALQDGDEGQPRNAQISDYSITKGIYTTSENAENLKGLMDFVRENGESVPEVILYGNVPGLGYLLNKSSALTTFWPDLDSYNYSEWERDLAVIKSEVMAGLPYPYVITSIPVAAWEGGNKEAIEYFGIDEEKYSQDQKLSDLVEFIHQCGYEQIYCNDQYSVYGIR